MRFFLLFFLLMEFLSAGEKVALLIGNNQYQFQPLSNPLNDVKEINKTLLKIGFKSKNIIVVQNGSQKEMENAIYQFHKKANDKEIALVYFSGHGIQVENNNYLFPANTTAHKESDLTSLIQLKLLIDSTSSAKYGVILVDACRTNPLVKSFKYEYKSDKKELNSKGKKGLGQVNTQQNKGEFIIGFATSAGNTADDGLNNTSPYVEALRKNLQLDLEIRKVLGKVGKEVSKKYPHQNPIVRSTLGNSDVCLTGNCGKNSKKTIIQGNINGGLNLGSGKIINNHY